MTFGPSRLEGAFDYLLRKSWWGEWDAQWRRDHQLNKQGQFEEAEHPRVPAGTSQGGQFTVKPVKKPRPEAEHAPAPGQTQSSFIRGMARAGVPEAEAVRIARAHFPSLTEVNARFAHRTALRQQRLEQGLQKPNVGRLPPGVGLGPGGITQTRGRVALMANQVLQGRTNAEIAVEVQRNFPRAHFDARELSELRAHLAQVPRRVERFAETISDPAERQRLLALRDRLDQHLISAAQVHNTRQRAETRPIPPASAPAPPRGVPKEPSREAPKEPSRPQPQIMGPRPKPAAPAYSESELRLVQQMGIDPQRFSRHYLESIYAADLGNGNHSDVRNFLITGSTLRWSGNFYGPTGQNYGNFEREISRDARGDLYAHNSSLFLSSEAQGKGMANRFYRAAEDRLRAAGVKYITITANGNVGMYAWARMGFDFTSENYRQGKLSRFSLFVDRATRGRYRINQSVAWHAWDIASFDVPEFRNERGWSLGKQFMMEDGSWSGVKLLDPNWEGYIVAEGYYAEKERQERQGQRA